MSAHRHQIKYESLLLTLMLVQALLPRAIVDAFDHMSENLQMSVAIPIPLPIPVDLRELGVRLVYTIRANPPLTTGNVRYKVPENRQELCGMLRHKRVPTDLIELCALTSRRPVEFVANCVHIVRKGQHTPVLEGCERVKLVVIQVDAPGYHWIELVVIMEDPGFAESVSHKDWERRHFESRRWFVPCKFACLAFVHVLYMFNLERYQANCKGSRLDIPCLT
jgi:hypothetical protein